MAITAPVSGKLTKIGIAAVAAGPYTTINGMNNFTKRNNRPTTIEETFDALNAYIDAAIREVIYDISGLFIIDDPGQLALRAAEQAYTQQFVQILPEGFSTVAAENVRGWIQQGVVASTTLTARPRGFHGYTWQFASQAAEVISGTGGYIV